MLSLLLLLAQPTPFACTAQGTRLLAPATSPEAACARLREGLAKAGVKPERARIEVALRFEKPGIATASVTRIERGRRTQLPDISVAVSDKAIAPSAIDLLAREIAARLARR